MERYAHSASLSTGSGIAAASGEVFAFPFILLHLSLLALVGLLLLG